MNEFSKPLPQSNQNIKLSKIYTRKVDEKSLPKRPAKSQYKRLFDILVSASAIIFLLPVLILIALAIKLTSKGSIFFRQQRAGLDGKPFYIFKFRSMLVVECGHTSVQATQNDSRVTLVGRFIRKTSLDELPQLFNIFLGDMSLVGPRPHAIAHDKAFAEVVSYYNERFKARPGLTGLAQIRGYRGECKTPDDVLNRVSADVEYIRDWSFTRDIMIILKTIPLIVSDKNAY